MCKALASVALVIVVLCMIGAMSTSSFARGSKNLDKCFAAQALCKASCISEDTGSARMACMLRKNCFHVLKVKCPGVCEYPKDDCNEVCNTEYTLGTPEMKKCKNTCNDKPVEVCPPDFVKP